MRGRGDMGGGGGAIKSEGTQGAYGMYFFPYVAQGAYFKEVCVCCSQFTYSFCSFAAQ